MSISIRLKKAIEAKQLRITESADVCGIPYRSMQNYLRGEREPNADALRLISERLGISADWLLTGRGKMQLADEMPCSALNPKEEALLTMFKELSEDDQREICRLAEDKKRLHDMSKQIEELQAWFEEFKKAH